MRHKKYVRKTAIVLLWLIAWQLLAWWVGNSVLLAGPWDTLKALGFLVTEPDFARTLLISCGKLTVGFGLGLLAGALLGALGGQRQLVDDLLRPILSFMKSVPVAAFVVLLLIWWGSKWLSVAIVFVVVFPHIYFAFCEGMKQVDAQMLEVANVFGMPLWNRCFYLYRRALKPFLDNGLKLSLGLSWKSGVAAEVIGTPDFSIGEGLYMAKTHLNTPEVFAWIVVILVLSAVYEKVGLLLWERFCQWRPRCKAPASDARLDKSATRHNSQGDLSHVEQNQEQEQQQEQRQEQQQEQRQGQYAWLISKAFGDKEIWNRQEIQLSAGQIYTWQAPSGRGKTTLLRILAGLETNQTLTLPKGKEAGKEKDRIDAAATDRQQISCSMVFQEDRLLLDETPLTNIEMVLGSHRREEIWQNLQEVIPELELQQTCQMLSGGMRRRVCLVRAMLSEAEIVLLDEPFVGLDEDAKKQMASYILKAQKGRCIVVVTHQETDKEMLNSIHWKM